jgi:hypothetical protein
MANNEKIESLLWVRFVGQNLDERSVPIYLLGESFIAFQRIVNKAYLAQNDRLGTGSQLTNFEREMLALQVGERRKESDGYGFLPFQITPDMMELLKGLATQIVIAFGQYAYQKIKTRNDTGNEKEQDSKEYKNGEKQPISESPEFVGSIHKDLSVIVRTIEGIGNIREIQFSVPNDPHVKAVVLNVDTKGYVQDLASQSYLGKQQDLTGEIARLEPGENIITIRKKHTRKLIRVYATENIFNDVRYSDIKENDFITFSGHPIHRYGDDVSKYDKFEAKAFLKAFLREKQH